MVWICCSSVKIAKKAHPQKQKVMDFRKADPTYLGFKPKTAEEAIDLFYRHKLLGVPVHLWPEVFVKCAADLKDAELDKFESWLVNPQGEPTGPTLEAVDVENEKLRKQLLAEATRRDMMKIDERGEELRSYPLVAELRSLPLVAVAVAVSYFQDAENSKRYHRTHR